MGRLCAWPGAGIFDTIMNAIRSWLIGLLVVAVVVSSCRKTSFLDSIQDDAPAVFEEAWTVLDQRYALFREKGIDWDSVRNVYAQQFVPGMSEQALFSTLSRMLETLRDGHLVLVSGTDTAAYDGYYRGYSRNFSLRHVLDNYLDGNYTSLGSLLFAVRENIGYIYVARFDTELGDDQRKRLAQAMEGTQGLIIDVRDNQGGLVQSASQLASWLTDRSLLVKYEQFKTGLSRASFGDPIPYSLLPFTTPYLKPVIVLTNRACFSACNDFVLYTAVMPQVKRYGDVTGGGGSIPSAYRLSNGWIMQYSATKTLSAALAPAEFGVFPDRQIEISALDDARGRDPILEAAFNDLR